MKNLTILVIILYASIGLLACNDDSTPALESTARDYCVWLDSCEKLLNVTHRKSIEDCVYLTTTIDAKCESQAIDAYSCSSKLNCKEIIEKVSDEVKAVCTTGEEISAECENKVLQEVDGYCKNEIDALTACRNK